MHAADFWPPPLPLAAALIPGVRTVLGLLAGNLNDLRMLDLSARVWTDRSGTMYGSPGRPRAFAGFASADGLLYLHGGFTSEGERLSGRALVPWCLRPVVV